MADMIMGSEFIAETRLAWIRHFAAAPKVPTVVQFWGTADQIVSAQDNADLEAFGGRVVRLTGADHDNPMRIDAPYASDPQARWALIRPLFFDPPAPASRPAYQPRRVSVPPARHQGLRLRRLDLGPARSCAGDGSVRTGQRRASRLRLLLGPPFRVFERAATPHPDVQGPLRAAPGREPAHRVRFHRPQQRHLRPGALPADDTVDALQQHRPGRPRLAGGFRLEDAVQPPPAQGPALRRGDRRLAGRHPVRCATRDLSVGRRLGGSGRLRRQPRRRGRPTQPGRLVPGRARRSSSRRTVHRGSTTEPTCSPLPGVDGTWPPAVRCSARSAPWAPSRGSRRGCCGSPRSRRWPS